MEEPLNEALGRLLSDVRPLLRELLEEGVASFSKRSAQRGEAERSPQDASAQRGEAERSPQAERRTEPPPPPVFPAPPSRPAPTSLSLGLLDDRAPWGERPTLEQVRAELGDCQRCRLCEGRRQIVFGDGNPDADLLFVGEGPGEQEDLQGIPFCGRAGELLTQMIERGLEIPRSSVYICNIVKCRPPRNRTPLGDEVARCRPFLDGQIAAVCPKAIVALGRPAASLLLGRELSITKVRGTWHEYRGIPTMPTFHPAFLLRQYTPENRRRVWGDLRAALARARENGGRFPTLARGAAR